MPSYIVKRAPGVDQYLVYSTVTDSPLTMPMSREDMKKYLVATATCRRCAEDESEERLARADLHGSSAFDAHNGWWDKSRFLVLGQMVSREELFGAQIQRERA